MFYNSKAFLLFLLFASIVWSAPSANNHLKYVWFSRLHAFSAVQQKPNVLAKKAALQYKQTGAIHYYNAGDFGGDTSWEFSSRDTIIYDADGNEIIKKTSEAESGWSDLESLDSSIYVNGKITEEISLYYLNNGSEIDYGYRTTYTYLDGGKITVATEYDWDNSLSKWTPYFKDSIIFTAPPNNMSDRNSIDMHSFLRDYTYSFDTTNLSWKSDGYLTKTDAECNSTTFVLSGKVSNDNDTLDNYKEILIYNSSVWNFSNLVEERTQEKNPDNGEYYDTYKYMSFDDSHKNDSLDVYCEFDTSTQSWDTISMYEYFRSYDANDNNISTIEKGYDPESGEWNYSSYDINLFEQIKVPVIHPEKAVSKQNVTITQTSGLIRFSAPGITALELYNTQGRLIASVKQNAASSVTLSLSGPNAKISSGSYIVRLVCKDVIKSFPMVIKR